uniref:Uncharacterized protein n=1 Tax=Branchiostoma floridae TaxID=7739 RepID=C3ZL50_BRAFL|eukprot:XP_002590721.1 hypothetical protein BRAFLDRAFT_89527 [Branchiostoma floridae]
MKVCFQQAKQADTVSSFVCLVYLLEPSIENLMAFCAALLINYRWRHPRFSAVSATFLRGQTQKTVGRVYRNQRKMASVGDLWPPAGSKPAHKLGWSDGRLRLTVVRSVAVRRRSDSALGAVSILILHYPRRLVLILTMPRQARNINLILNQTQILHISAFMTVSMFRITIIILVVILYIKVRTVP